MAIIQDVWYGRKSLATTFWSWNIVYGYVAFVYFVATPAKLLAEEMQSMFPVYVVWLIELPLRLWLIIGLWRSATRAGGAWAATAKVFVVVTVAVNVLSYYLMFKSTPEDFSRALIPKVQPGSPGIPGTPVP